MTQPHPIRRRAILVAVLPALALAGCKQPAPQSADGGGTMTNASAMSALPATVPLTDAPASALAAAPAAEALPAARASRVVRVADPRQSYAWADRAAAMSGAVDNAPPDYAFEYGGVQPWAWRGDDGSTEFVEPVEGGYRRYYYEPGADRPYFVRDPDYAYGFDGDDLAVVYGPGGEILPPEYAERRSRYAGRYLVRAAALFAASAAIAHRGVAEADWRARRAELSAERARWDAEQARQGEWRAYHDQHAAEERSHWQNDRAVRAPEADRYAGGDRGGGPGDGGYAQDRGPPPGFRQAQADRRQQDAQLQQQQQQQQDRQRQQDAQRRQQEDELQANRRQALAQRERADSERAAIIRRQQQVRVDQARQVDRQRDAADEASQRYAARPQSAPAWLTKRVRPDAAPGTRGGQPPRATFGPAEQARDAAQAAQRADVEHARALAAQAQARDAAEALARAQQVARQQDRIVAQQQRQQAFETQRTHDRQPAEEQQRQPMLARIAAQHAERGQAPLEPRVEVPHVDPQRGLADGGQPRGGDRPRPGHDGHH